MRVTWWDSGRRWPEDNGRVFSDQAVQAFEMGYSRKEFDALLKLQHSFPYQPEGDHQFVLQWQDQPVIVRLGTESTRRIASMVMSKLPIEMELSAIVPEQRQQFLTAFLKTFMKGGG